jgi:hypothetical protein
VVGGGASAEVCHLCLCTCWVLHHPVVLVLWYSVWSLLVFVVLVVIGGGGVPLVGRYVEARGKGREKEGRERKEKGKGRRGVIYCFFSAKKSIIDL